jgi:pseudo-rSAM protein
MIAHRWLYLEPFVHISEKQHKVLLYNTLNGKSLEYNSNNELYKLIKRLNRNKNLLVVSLSSIELQREDIKKFIHQLRKNFMGDIIDSFDGKQKPIQIKPIFNIHKSIKILKESKDVSVGTKIMQNLSEISIQINDICDLDCKGCFDFHRQFHFCTKNQNQTHELDILNIEKILNDIYSARVSEIHITGGNILKYSKLTELMELFVKSAISVVFHIHYRNILPAQELLYLFKKNMAINVLTDEQIEHESVEQIKQLLEHKNIITNFTFIISNKSKFVIIDEMIKKTCIENYNIQPFYSNNNFSFFKENVFLSKRDIFDAKPSIYDIYLREVINPNFFGKLTILCNGDIYANTNLKTIGNIKSVHLAEAASKEMNTGTSWRKTRKKVYPCKDCLYKFLCPPISNYEYCIGRFNLCTIFNNTKDIHS